MRIINVQHIEFYGISDVFNAILRNYVSVSPVIIFSVTLCHVYVHVCLCTYTQQMLAVNLAFEKGHPLDVWIHLVVCEIADSRSN